MVLQVRLDDLRCCRLVPLVTGADVLVENSVHAGLHQAIAKYCRATFDQKWRRDGIAIDSDNMAFAGIADVNVFLALKAHDDRPVVGKARRSRTGGRFGTSPCASSTGRIHPPTLRIADS